MTTNFEITDNCGVTVDGRLFDLHNNFDLAGFTYDISTRHFEIKWVKGKGSWINKNEIIELTLSHKKVTFLRIGTADENSLMEDDKCLGDISFFPSSSRDINDNLLIQNQPNEGDDILFILESGRTIRIGCEAIELTYKSNATEYPGTIQLKS